MNAQHRRRLTSVALTIAGAAVAVAVTASSASALPPPGVGGGGGTGGSGGGTHSSCGDQNHQSAQVTTTLKESNRTDSFVFSVPPCGRVTLSASGNVTDGWWFHGYDGPEGWVNNLGGSDYPLPGDNTGAVIARFDGARYVHVGAGTTLTNSSTTATKNLYLFRNDNVPGNGSGSFSVVSTLYGP